MKREIAAPRVPSVVRFESEPTNNGSVCVVVLFSNALPLLIVDRENNALQGIASPNDRSEQSNFVSLVTPLRIVEKTMSASTVVRLLVIVLSSVV